MSKKILSLISVVMVLAMLAACGGDGGAPATPAGDGEWKWERKIEIVCPWGAGGGADTTVRQFATQLEKELGRRRC